MNALREWYKVWGQITMCESGKKKYDPIEIEAKLIEQEHRTFVVVKTFFDRQKWLKGDPRKRASKVAFAWLWLAPSHLAVTGGLATAFITIYLLASQNAIIKEQNIFFQEQILQTSRMANLEKRTRLVDILWNGNESQSKRVTREAVIEFIEVERSIQTTPTQIIDLSGIDMSTIIFENIDFSYCIMNQVNLVDTFFANCTFDNTAMNGVVLGNTVIKGEPPRNTAIRHTREFLGVPHATADLPLLADDEKGQFLSRLTELAMFRMRIEEADDYRMSHAEIHLLATLGNQLLSLYPSDEYLQFWSDVPLAVSADEERGFIPNTKLTAIELVYFIEECLLLVNNELGSLYSSIYTSLLIDPIGDDGTNLHFTQSELEPWVPVETFDDCELSSHTLSTLLKIQSSLPESKMNCSTDITPLAVTHNQLESSLRLRYEIIFD